MPKKKKTINTNIFKFLKHSKRFYRHTTALRKPPNTIIRPQPHGIETMHSVFQVQQIRGISHPQHGRGGRNHGHVRYDDSKRVQKHDSGQRNRDLSRAMDRRTVQHRILHDRGIRTLTIRDPSIRTLTARNLSHT